VSGVAALNGWMRTTHSVSRTEFVPPGTWALGPPVAASDISTPVTLHFNVMLLMGSTGLFADAVRASNDAGHRTVHTFFAGG